MPSKQKKLVVLLGITLASVFVGFGIGTLIRKVLAPLAIAELVKTIITLAVITPVAMIWGNICEHVYNSLLYKGYRMVLVAKERVAA